MAAPRNSGPRPRTNSTLSAAQVAEVLYRRERQGQTMGLIARLMDIPITSVKGVIYGGCGARTLPK